MVRVVVCVYFAEILYGRKAGRGRYEEGKVDRKGGQRQKLDELGLREMVMWGWKSVDLPCCSTRL